MSISFSCDCGKSYKVGDSAAGKKTRCKDCGEVITVPSSGGPTKKKKARAVADYEDDYDDEYDDGGDDYDDGYGDDDYEEAPRRRRSKSSGSRSGGASSKKKKKNAGNTKLILIIVGSVLGTGAIVGLVFLIMYLAGDSHERLANDSIALAEDLFEILETAKDESSAKAAATKIRGLVGRAERLAERNQALGTVPVDDLKEIQERLKPRMEKLRDRIRLGRPSAEVQKILQPAMMELGAAMNKIPKYVKP